MSYETALKAGWKISPIKAGMKGGPGAYLKDNSWKNLVSDQVEAELYPPDCNWAFEPGINGHIVIDVDNKHGKKGSVTLLSLKEELGELPPTLVVATPSGGYHYYYKLPTGIDQSILPDGVDILGEGIDVRIRGYVVLFGSRVQVNGTRKLYEVINHPRGGLTHIPEIPEAWLSRLILLKGSSSSSDEDSPAGKPELEEGCVVEGGRDNFLFHEACALRRRGFDGEILQTLLTEISERYCHPHDQGMVDAKVKQALKYDPKTDVEFINDAMALARIKARFGDGIFDDETEETDPLGTDSMKVVMKDGMKNRQWLLEGRFLPDYLTLTSAEGGTGKSTLAIAEALAVATGKEEMVGKKISAPSPVWYFSTEDTKEEIQRKLAAYCHKYNIDKEADTPLYISSSAHTNGLVLCREKRGEVFVDKELVARMIERIKELNVKLLIVDPFVRSHRVNENDNSQIDEVMQQFSFIARKTSCAIHLVHHTSKGAVAKGNQNAPRGAGALVNSVRVAHNLYRFSEKERQKYGLDNQHLALELVKCNILISDVRAVAYKKVSVNLPELAFAAENDEKVIGDQSIGAVVPVDLNAVIRAKELADIPGGTDEEFSDLEEFLFGVAAEGPEKLSVAYVDLINQRGKKWLCDRLRLPEDMGDRSVKTKLIQCVSKRSSVVAISQRSEGKPYMVRRV
jgi:hypothetical protein